jgi:hypothetical protein
MRFALWRGVAVFLGTGIIIFCSCERHHFGELPEDQKLIQMGKAEPNVTHAARPPGASATPADFFPQKTKP